MLANPFNWRVRWPRPARVPLFSLGLRYLEVHVATAGGWLTRYRPREVRNSIYRYRKIHIDYRSKFLYRFISPISIIYGNTNSHYEDKTVMRPSYLYNRNPILVKLYLYIETAPRGCLNMRMPSHKHRDSHQNICLLVLQDLICFGADTGRSH